MKYLILLLPTMFLHFNITAQVSPFEKSKGKKTTDYFECIDWYRQLAKKYPQLQIKEMGATDAGYPLHLVLISNDGRFDFKSRIKEKKLVILINNGIHPGEPDGIDASMMLARNLLQKKELLPLNTILAIIPVYNIGGCLNRNAYTRANQNGPETYGFRGNAQNLDLNRDFTKCDSKESKTFASIFQYLQPDIFIDTHVSDGADFQHSMTLITTQYDKLGAENGQWLRAYFEPELYRSMQSKGWDMIPYVNFETADFDNGMVMFPDPPRYSSGYAALFNTLSFITETHMLKDFAQRVQSTYDLLLTFIEQGSKNAETIMRIKEKAQQAIITQTSFPLSWKSDSSRYDEIVFKGYVTRDTLSAATGLQKTVYDHNSPYTKKIRFYNRYLPENIIKKPRAYLIPQGWHTVIDLLKLNGVQMVQFKKDSTLEVEVTHISSYKSQLKPYEKHHRNYEVKVTSQVESQRFLKGDYIIALNQPANRYIIEMLEPTGDDSFFSWNFFDAILQQKEGYSDHRWEDIAADLLKTNPTLQLLLENKKNEDPKFASNSNAILEFIYKHSSYYEKAHMRYPIFRINE